MTKNGSVDHRVLPIVDNFQRIHNSLRISITDRCNIRCFYCMPLSTQFLPRTELLTFEEIVRIVRILTDCGVNKIRLTGGEPLVRADVSRLIEMLAGLPGIQDIALTTNGLLLAEQARELLRAGLKRLNISLDALDPVLFERIARRTGLEKVLEGITAAIAAGFQNIRLNAVSIKGITESEIVPLALFARQHQLTLRFIEFMPLDAEKNWDSDQVLAGEQVRRIIGQQVSELEPSERTDPRQPAVDYQYADGGGRVGFINSVTEPFCENCNRMRISAEGKFRNCLFSAEEWDVRSLLRSGGSDAEIEKVIRECVMAKKAGHGTDSYQFHRPTRTMHQIGG
jgi:cyclic pyranopterin phosphate synthase